MVKMHDALDPSRERVWEFRWYSLGLPRALAWRWGDTGTSVPFWARASVTALGAFQVGTNELFGKDPSVV